MESKIVKQFGCLQMKNVLFIFSCIITVSANDLINQNVTLSPTEEYILKNGPKNGITYSLNTLLSILNGPEYINRHSVKVLVSTFEMNCDLKDFSQERKHPFIVVESNQRNGRRIFVDYLSHKLGAKQISGVPICIKHLHRFFYRDVELKRMFFSLSNYVQSFNARKILQNYPVVLAGYWMDQMTFCLGRTFKELPPVGSIFYNFPEDLLKPDVVFYLYFNTTQTNIPPRDIISNKITEEVYNRLRNPSVYKIITKYVTESDVDLAVNFIKETCEKVIQNGPKYGLTYSFDSLLNALKGKEFNNSKAVHLLLATYELNYVDKRPKPKDKVLHPFVVIESNEWESRQILASMLAKNVGAKALKGIPLSIKHLRRDFCVNPALKNMYFSMSTYITSHVIKKLLRFHPVILAGYWIEQTSFSLAKIFEKLPPVNSFFYNLPEDLMKPDLVVYLDIESSRKKMNPEQLLMLEKIQEVYRRMRNPKVVEMKANHVTDVEVMEITEIIKRLIGKV